MWTHTHTHFLVLGLHFFLNSKNINCHTEIWGNVYKNDAQDMQNISVLILDMISLEVSSQVSRPQKLIQSSSETRAPCLERSDRCFPAGTERLPECCGSCL